MMRMFQRDSTVCDCTVSILCCLKNVIKRKKKKKLAEDSGNRIALILLMVKACGIWVTLYFTGLLFHHNFLKTFQERKILFCTKF